MLTSFLLNYIFTGALVRFKDRSNHYNSFSCLVQCQKPLWWLDYRRLGRLPSFVFENHKRWSDRFGAPCEYGDDR